MTPSRPTRDALLALTLMSVVPARVEWPEGERVDIAGWFPMVGVVLGLFGALFVELAGWMPLSGSRALLVAAVLITVWAALTRFLHWDGLADVADGLWGGHTPERRLEIMSDSATGAFGATAIALTAIVSVAGASGLITSGSSHVLLAVPVMARLAPAFAAWIGRPARTSGLGRSVMTPPGIGGAAAAIVAVAIAGAVMWSGSGAMGLYFLGALLFAALAVPHVLSLPVGGVTGDIMGASVIICEALGLAAGAFVWGP